MNTKKLSEWEQEKGFIVVGADDFDKQLTEEEFMQLEGRHGVDHSARAQFLTENGFEVNRDTLIDHRLSAGHKIIVDGEILDYDEYLAKP